jgi:hypothetical protein
VTADWCGERTEKPDGETVTCHMPKGHTGLHKGGRVGCRLWYWYPGEQPSGPTAADAHGPSGERP